jgi:hypothetical protein
MTTEASIIAALPSYLSFAADGTRVLNKEGLRTWVKAQMTAAMGANVYAVSQIDGQLDEALNKLAATIAPANWAKRSDWPAGNDESLKEANGARAAAVAASFTALRKAAGQVTGAYVALTDSMNQKVKDYAVALFSESGGLPVPVVRNVESRFYVATFVTDWGEESMPSGPSIMVEMDQNDTATITRTGAIPTDRGAIVAWRLYRSNVGSAGTAFQLVVDVPIATAVWVDTQKSSQLANDTLVSLSWMEPPVGLRGMTGMANGIMAGFVDKTIYFCEPYYPYAWPHGPDSLTSYDLSIKHAVVGMASFGSNLFVGTEATPYMVSGSDSASMSAIELSSGQSCVSARSIVAVENGAIYASPDGLCMATFNGVEVLTQALFSREDWQALVPSRIQAALHDSVYYFMWTDNEGAGCYALDFVAKKLTRVGMTGSAMYSDPLTDTLFVARGNQIISVFCGTRRTGKFKTGIINVAAQQPFAWLQVDSDYTAPVMVKWYGDGVLRHTATLTSIAPVRLPPGRYLEHEVEIETTARVTKLTMAGSTDEMKQS